MKTKKVRILKDGNYKDVDYHKGEIWEYVDNFSNNILIIKKEDRITKVSINSITDYGLEAEIIEEDVIEQSKELTINLW